MRAGVFISADVDETGIGRDGAVACPTVELRGEGSRKVGAGLTGA